MNIELLIEQIFGSQSSSVVPKGYSSILKDPGGVPWNDHLNTL